MAINYKLEENLHSKSSGIKDDHTFFFLTLIPGNMLGIYN